MDFDRILQECGDFNRYQYLTLVICALVSVTASVHYFAQVIIGFVPNHWCYHEKLENHTFAEINAIYSQFKYPSCTRLEDIVGDKVVVSAEQCTRWIYQYDFGYRSMNTELNWVCGSAYKAHIGQSFFFVGSVVGTLLCGFLADKVGRLSAMSIINFIGFFGDLFTAHSSTLMTFAFCRFVAGLISDSNSTVMYIIVMENMRPTLRGFAITISAGIFYPIGLVFAPWFAVLTGNWKIYLYCSSLMSLTICVYYFVLQESAQWLMSRNNVDEAIKRLKRVAKINRRTVADVHFEQFRLYCKMQMDKANADGGINGNKLSQVFEKPRLRKHASILIVQSIFVTLCYNVSSIYVEDIGISPLLLFSLNGLVGVPTNLLLMIVLGFIGRKGAAVCTSLLGAIITTIACMSYVHVDWRTNNTLLLCLTVIRLFTCQFTYSITNIYRYEILPTCVRAQGVSILKSIGMAAAFFSPYIIWLGVDHPEAPSILLSVFLLGSACSFIFLPETINRTLPKTLEEAENLGSDEHMLHFLCCHYTNEHKNNEDSV